MEAICYDGINGKPFKPNKIQLHLLPYCIVSEKYFSFWIKDMKILELFLEEVMSFITQIKI